MENQDVISGNGENMKADPLAYFSATFSNPSTLLAAMNKSGSVVSGSRALEFFVPGSTTRGSDWDFYVPGYRESVISMVSTLELCGVSWKTAGDALISAIEQKRSEIVPRSTLNCIYSWVRGLPPTTAELLVGKTLHNIMEIYQDMRLSCDAESYYIATENDELYILPMYGPAQYQSSTYTDGNGRAFSILHGCIRTHCGSQNIQLIIGSYYSGIKGSMSFIKDFYASHVQCFIGGWCAGHLYYKEAREKLAILWNSGKSIPVQKAIEKYSERGFRFVSATGRRPVERHLYDDGSLLIDYGDTRPDFFQQESPSIEAQLDERRNSIKAIRWFELGGRIFSFHNSYDSFSRSCSKFTPLNDFLDLNDAALVHHDALRTIVKSGTVYEGLRDATLWSWVL